MDGLDRAHGGPRRLRRSSSAPAAAAAPPRPGRPAATAAPPRRGIWAARSTCGQSLPAARRPDLGPDRFLPGPCSWRHGRRKSPAAAAGSAASLVGAKARPASSSVEARRRQRAPPASLLPLPSSVLLPLVGGSPWACLPAAPPRRASLLRPSRTSLCTSSPRLSRPRGERAVAAPRRSVAVSWRCAWRLSGRRPRYCSSNYGSPHPAPCSSDPWPWPMGLPGTRSGRRGPTSCGTGARSGSLVWKPPTVVMELGDHGHGSRGCATQGAGDEREGVAASETAGTAPVTAAASPLIIRPRRLQRLCPGSRSPFKFCIVETTRPGIGPRIASASD